MNWLCRLLCRHPRLILSIGPVSEQTLRLTVFKFNPWFFKGELFVAITLTDSQQCVLTVKAVDKKGNPTTVTPGSIVWAVDNPSLLTVTANPDGSAVLAAVGPLGSGTVSVKATVAGGDVAGSADVSVISGAPTTLTIDAAAPTEQP